jgi:hypothetical protein
MRLGINSWGTLCTLSVSLHDILHSRNTQDLSTANTTGSFIIQKISSVKFLDNIRTPSCANTSRFDHPSSDNSRMQPRIPLTFCLNSSSRFSSLRAILLLGTAEAIGAQVRHTPPSLLSQSPALFFSLFIRASLVNKVPVFLG